MCRPEPSSRMWPLPHHRPRYECLKVDALIALTNYRNMYPTFVPYVKENSVFAKNHVPSFARYVWEHVLESTSIEHGGKQLFMSHTVPTYVVICCWFVFYWKYCTEDPRFRDTIGTEPWTHEQLTILWQWTTTTTSISIEPHVHAFCNCQLLSDQDNPWLRL